jgi:hypothetical protein
MKSRMARLAPVLAVVFVVLSIGAILGLVWYPTTLQPNIVLRDATYTTHACVPVSGGYATRYDWTFTVANSGPANGVASIALEWNGYTVGYDRILVPRNSEIAGSRAMYGEVFASPAGCGPPETTGIRLASVTRDPEIDPRTVVVSVVSPIVTIAFSGALFGALHLSLRRRGRSMFGDFGLAGWAIAFLILTAASLFSGVVTQVVVTPYNVPLDWTPALVYGAIATAAGGFLVRAAYRMALRTRDVARLNAS